MAADIYDESHQLALNLTLAAMPLSIGVAGMLALYAALLSAGIGLYRRRRRHYAQASVVE